MKVISMLLLVWEIVFLLANGKLSDYTIDLDYERHLAPTETTPSLLPLQSTTSVAVAVAATATAGRGLPTLEELMVIPDEGYDCPEGTAVFDNIVLPESITHANRKIPKVVHITAATRCVSEATRDHILKWKFPNHSLYLHDDASVYRLLEYTRSDQFGNELVQNISKIFLCMTSGATLSDVWRYIMIYNYGGLYTDLDNLPGPSYNSSDMIESDTDAFFLVEEVGTMSQFYFASSPKHPFFLHTLMHAVSVLYNNANDNVMVNNPATRTGPRAIRKGMVAFQRAINITNSGYVPNGTYIGGLGDELEAWLPWYSSNSSNQDKEYPTPSEFANRSVTILGDKLAARQRIYIDRMGMKGKIQQFELMNMSHYQKDRSMYPKKNHIGCRQHVSRMETLTRTNTSFYYNKTAISDLTAKYKFNQTIMHYFDPRSNEIIIPWTNQARSNK